MSAGRYEQEKLTAKGFEDLLNQEIAYAENLMRPAEIEMKMKNMTIMTQEEAVETGMMLIRKAGFLLLRFNGLTEDFKVSLFDKLMEYIEKFKKLLEKYGKKMGVESFSITVGFPWGASISLSFKPK